MNKLSIALAVFNEEENLDKCLKSIAKIAEEIVIVDGGSSDKTLEIAKKYQAKIISTNNPPLFHINKQKALDACSGDWILQLDADEVVTEELAQEIKEVIVKNTKYHGYYLQRKNYFLGAWLKKGGQYPDPVIRLVKKGKAIFPCVSVHEQIKVEGEVGTLRNDLLHYTALTFSRYLVNSNRYTSLTADEYEKNKLPINVINNLKYLFLRPLFIFLKIYFRHKGFVDGIPGLVFAVYSGLHVRTSYVKYWEKRNSH